VCLWHFYFGGGGGGVGGNGLWDSPRLGSKDKNYRSCSLLSPTHPASPPTPNARQLHSTATFSSPPEYFSSPPEYFPSPLGHTNTRTRPTHPSTPPPFTLQPLYAMASELRASCAADQIRNVGALFPGTLAALEAGEFFEPEEFSGALSAECVAAVRAAAAAVAASLPAPEVRWGRVGGVAERFVMLVASSGGWVGGWGRGGWLLYVVSVVVGSGMDHWICQMSDHLSAAPIKCVHIPSFLRPLSVV
jgi:hypothetical protein